MYRITPMTQYTVTNGVLLPVVEFCVVVYIWFFPVCQEEKDSFLTVPKQNEFTYMHVLRCGPQCIEYCVFALDIIL